MEIRPDISPNFTIEDIHKIREWNYERRKDMTNDELKADIEQGADAFEKRIKEARQRKQNE